MTFGKAVEHLKAGKLLGRHGWNGKDMFLVLIKNWKIDHQDIYDTDLEMESRPSFIALKNTKDQLVPWNASQEDALATDWDILQ